MEVSACLNHWLSERWLTATAADLAVLLATWLVTNERGLPEGYAAIPYAALLGAQVALLAIYLASTIVRTLLRGFTFTWFETAQCALAFLISVGGGLQLTSHDARVAPALGAARAGLRGRLLPGLLPDARPRRRGTWPQLPHLFHVRHSAGRRRKPHSAIRRRGGRSVERARRGRHLGGRHFPPSDTEDTRLHLPASCVGRVERPGAGGGPATGLAYVARRRPVGHMERRLHGIAVLCHRNPPRRRGNPQLEFARAARPGGRHSSLSGIRHCRGSAYVRISRDIRRGGDARLLRHPAHFGAFRPPPCCSPGVPHGGSASSLRASYIR